MHRNRTWLIGSSAEERIRNRTLPVEGGDGSTLSLDFTTGVLDPRLTFTRTSNATFINSSGLVQYAFSNRIPNSASLSGFSATGVTAVADSNEPGPVVAPSGTQATKVTVNGGATTVSFSRNFGTGAGTATGMTYSIYLKPSRLNNGSGFRYSIRNETTGLNTYGVDVVWANSPVTVNEVLGAADGDYQLSGPDANGWYRLILRVTNTGLIRPGDNLTVYAGYTGQGTGFFDASGAYWVWGAQLEPGLTASPVYLTGATSTGYFDVPRFDYDPTSIGTPRGLLIEGSANNLCTYSGDMTQSGAGHWTTRTNLDTSSWTGFTAPDETATAVKLIPNTTNGLHNIQNVSGSLTLVAYTASAFVKADGRTVVGLAIGGSQAWQNFVLTGSGSLGSASTSPAPTSTITPVGSTGWYRVTMTWTSTLSASGVQLFVTLPQTSSTSPFSAYAGDGTQNGVQAWGYQLELGSGASSYIPTGASTGSRAADVCYMDGTNFSSWYNASTQTGTLFADITHSAASGPNSGIELGAGLGSQITSNRVSLRRDAVIVDGVPALTVSPINASQRFKTAIAFAPGTGNTAACRNGGTVSNPAQAAGTLSGINALKLYVDSTLYPYGWIRQVKVWPTTLPNAQLQSITT